MIVEFPAAGCVAHATPAVKTTISNARRVAFEPAALPSTSRFTLHGSATISGVGFFDLQHSQTGVTKPIELHPGFVFAGRCSTV
jgi:hypothetical protein